MRGYEEKYALIVQKILTSGELRETRNGSTRALFGETLSFSIEKEFPLLRGRKLFYKPVLGEFAAMLRGPTNIEDFKKFGCNYWDEWGDMEGHLKLDYGNSWIDFNGINQLKNLVDGIKRDPTGRRHIVTGWRPDRLAELSLPCCHMLYQFYVREGKYIDMIWYQRSADWMVGVPSDAILAAAWTIALAAETGYKPGRVTMMFGDTHIYGNHIEKAELYLKQLDYNIWNCDDVQPFKYSYLLSTKLDTFEPNHILVDNYIRGQYQPAIKFELNV